MEITRRHSMRHVLPKGGRTLCLQDVVEALVLHTVHFWMALPLRPMKYKSGLPSPPS